MSQYTVVTWGGKQNHSLSVILIIFIHVRIKKKKKSCIAPRTWMCFHDFDIMWQHHHGQNAVCDTCTVLPLDVTKHYSLALQFSVEEYIGGKNIDWNKGQNIIFRDISPKAYSRFISDGIKPQKCLISPIIQTLSHAAAVTASSHFTQISFHFTFLLRMWKF